LFKDSEVARGLLNQTAKREWIWVKATVPTYNKQLNVAQF